MASKTTAASTLISRIEATANQISNDKMTVRFQTANQNDHKHSTIIMPPITPDLTIKNENAEILIG